MELQHVNVKIFLDGQAGVDAARFIEVFHEWIQKQSMDELLIDVADYRHVPAGPGVILIGHEADYSMDNAGNRYGLRYNRKATLDGSNEDRIRQALSSAARACNVLETHFADDGPFKFDRREFELFINDRALAPNTPDTYAACKAELESCFQNTFGHAEFSLEHLSDPRTLFGVSVKLDRPFDLAALSNNQAS